MIKSKCLLFFLFSVYMLVAQKQYFQQHLDYKIRVTLNDDDHTLNGSIQIVYKNNSPDVLDKIGFHLWPNAYSNKQTAFAKQKLNQKDTEFYDASQSAMGSIDQLDFNVNGVKSSIQFLENNPDMAWLILPGILKPGDSILISTPFHVKLPESFSRLGHVDQTYQITQWYPKPAVYDHKGWHLMPYLDQGEFYSEFGNFDVHITLPKNYIVGATGSLQNAEELLFLEKRMQETQNAIDKKNTLIAEIPTSSTENKTLQYTAYNVHDFAWFADKTFYVQRSHVILNSGKKIDTWTLFNNIQLWNESVNYVNRSIAFYSKNVGEYPWPQATAVESALSAGAGMEYPMITVIGPTSSKQSLDQVITHEVGHNWFYGVLASNERDHPYMDEGINSYYENRYMDLYYPTTNQIDIPKKLITLIGPFKLEQMMYLIFARTYSDQHPNQPSERFTSINYGNDVYYKSASLFAYAEKSLGTPAFDNIMKRYYQTWKFKHPYPEDLQQLFKNQTASDTKWLFDGFLNSDQKMDYGFCGIKKKEKQYTITIYNRGKIAAPFTISGIKNGLVVEEKWMDGFTGKTNIAYPLGEYDFFAIDYKQESYDLYSCNNYIRTKGLFKKTEPIKIRAFPIMDLHGRTDIGITPVVGNNVYNGFMAGFFLSGPWLPSKNWTVSLMPLYGFRNKKIAGQCELAYSWFFIDKKIKSMTLSIHSKLYGYNKYSDDTYLNYYQMNPGITIEFKHLPASLKQSQLNYTTYWIQDEFVSFKDTTAIVEQIHRIDHQLKYSFKKNSVLGDFGFESSLNYLNQKLTNNINQELLRMQITVEKSFRYKSKRYIEARSFLAFYPINTQRKSNYISSRSVPNFYRGSTGLAYQNYLDDDNQDIFLGRSATDGLWSQQIFIKQGGFKLVHGLTQRSNLGNSNEFLCSANFSTDLPIKYIGKIVRPYFDIGYFEHSLIPNNEKFLFSGGINIRVVPGFLDIYFPLIHSKNIRNLYLSDSKHSYWKEISFSLKLKKPGLNDLLKQVGY